MQINVHHDLVLVVIKNQGKLFHPQCTVTVPNLLVQIPIIVVQIRQTPIISYSTLSLLSVVVTSHDIWSLMILVLLTNKVSEIVILYLNVTSLTSGGMIQSRPWTITLTCTTCSCSQNENLNFSTVLKALQARRVNNNFIKFKSAPWICIQCVNIVYFLRSTPVSPSDSALLLPSPPLSQNLFAKFRRQRRRLSAHSLLLSGP